jgi:preprotein translocase subunit SecE
VAEAVAAAPRSFPGRVVAFLRDVRAEIGKVTWPTRDEIRKATIVIVIFVAVLGTLIGIMDTLLQLVLVRMVAQVF